MKATQNTCIKPYKTKRLFLSFYLKELMPLKSLISSIPISFQISKTKRALVFLEHSTCAVEAAQTQPLYQLTFQAKLKRN